jgi:hypothetical protein
MKEITKAFDFLCEHQPNIKYLFTINVTDSKVPTVIDFETKIEDLEQMINKIDNLGEQISDFNYEIRVYDANAYRNNQPSLVYTKKNEVPNPLVRKLALQALKNLN